MKVNSVKGTNDYLPKETALRDYLQGKILETYRACGFERITKRAVINLTRGIFHGGEQRSFGVS